MHVNSKGNLSKESVRTQFREAESLMYFDDDGISHFLCIENGDILLNPVVMKYHVVYPEEGKNIVF